MIVLPSSISNYPILKHITYYINYNNNNLLYYVTKPCYNKSSKPSKLWILVIDPIWLIEPSRVESIFW